MVIPKASHIDSLEVGRLRGPLLDDYYGSAIQRQDVMQVAEEIKRRHLAKLPSQTGNLRSTARVTAHRSREHRDRRYEAEYSIGGPRAPYIVPLEDEHHYLDQVLREMGFYTGDIVSGPTGTIPAEEKRPADATHVADAEREANVNSGEQTQKSEPPTKAPSTITSEKVRAGLYKVSGGGRTFDVEQRLDIPGQPWWATEPEAFHDPHRGSFRTKGAAMKSLRAEIEHGGDQ